MKFFSQGLLARVLSVLLVCSMMSVSFGSVASARFISPDSVDPTTKGVGTNRYAYAGNDPVNHGDPNGHIFGADDIIGGLIGIGIATLSAFFGGTKEANAPGPNEKIANTTDTTQVVNMAIGAAGGTAAGRIAGTAAKDALNNKDAQKDAATADKKAQMGLNTDGKNFTGRYTANGDSYAVTGVRSVQGKTVEISEFRVQKVGEDTSVNASATAQIRSQMAQQFATEGFDRLSINATRISGANPDRLMNVTIDLSRYR